MKRYRCTLLWFAVLTAPPCFGAEEFKLEKGDFDFRRLRIKEKK